MIDKCKNCDYPFQTEEDGYIDDEGVLRCINCSQPIYENPQPKKDGE